MPYICAYADTRCALYSRRHEASEGQEPNVGEAPDLIVNTISGPGLRQSAGVAGRPSAQSVRGRLTSIDGLAYVGVPDREWETHGGRRFFSSSPRKRPFIRHSFIWPRTQSYEHSASSMSV